MTPRSLGLILSAAIVLCLSACGGNAKTNSTDSPAAPKGTIVAVLLPFPAERTYSEIVVVEPGGRVRKIASSRGAHGILPSVSVSPDGRTVAYDDVGKGIHTVGIDGTHDQILEGTDGATSAAWSPDGRRLAYDTSDAYKDSDHGVILVRDARTASTRRLTPAHQIPRDQAPRWLPDGRIVFQHYDGPKTHFDIWVMNGDGSHRRQLTNDPGSEILPVPSPDGKQIAFSGFTENGGNSKVLPIRIIDLQGKVVRSLPGTDFADAWSPDGKQLLVDSTASSPPNAGPAAEDDFGLWLRDVAGGPGKVLLDVPGPGTIQSASWAAKG